MPGYFQPRLRRWILALVEINHPMNDHRLTDHSMNSLH
jgi:hypothetical protein